MGHAHDSNSARRRSSARCTRWMAGVVVALVGPCAPHGPANGQSTPADERRNWFDDPFVAATTGQPGCPAPEPPLLTEEQMRREAHQRAERGTSCYQSGRCRLPNAYLYDREIVPRVVKAIRADGRFANTSVWVEGQRRWVWLKGCVAMRRTEAGARAAGAPDRRRRSGDRPDASRHGGVSAAVPRARHAVIGASISRGRCSRCRAPDSARSRRRSSASTSRGPRTRCRRSR